MVESHPPSELPDLRLLAPFPALESHLAGVDWAALSDKQHSHVPYVAVLYRHLQQWILDKGGPPATYREKKELAAAIRRGAGEGGRRL